MKPKRGYYSLIQFCPEPSRLEAVNVGVVLLCPEADFIAARTAAGNRRAEKLVGRGELDRAALNSAKQAVEHRLHVDRDSFQSIEDLRKFVDTRGNNLKLTDPRPMKVFSPQEDLDELFAELVGGRSSAQRREPLSAELNELFQRLHGEDRARLNWTVEVPVLGRSLQVPYAYRNGVWNLVRPTKFSPKVNVAVSVAMRLAMEGDLLQRHEDEDDEGPKRLVVVTLFSEDGNGQCSSRVQELLTEYNVKTVRQEEVGVFAAEVEQDADSAT